MAHFLSFVAFATANAVAPGPNTFLTLRNTVIGGRVRAVDDARHRVRRCHPGRPRRGGAGRDHRPFGACVPDDPLARCRLPRLPRRHGAAYGHQGAPRGLGHDAGCDAAEPAPLVPSGIPVQHHEPEGARVQPRGAAAVRRPWHRDAHAPRPRPHPDDRRHDRAARRRGAGHACPRCTGTSARQPRWRGRYGRRHARFRGGSGCRGPTSRPFGRQIRGRWASQAGCG